jgi:hypothetical protein
MEKLRQGPVLHLGVKGLNDDDDDDTVIPDDGPRGQKRCSNKFSKKQLC